MNMVRCDWRIMAWVERGWNGQRDIVILTGWSNYVIYIDHIKSKCTLYCNVIGRGDKYGVLGELGGGLGWMGWRWGLIGVGWKEG